MSDSGRNRLPSRCLLNRSPDVVTGTLRPILASMLLLAFLPFPLSCLASSDGDENRSGAAAGSAAEAGEGLSAVGTSNETNDSAQPYRDPAEVLVGRIKEGKYESRAELMTGRFLEDCDLKAIQLKSVETKKMRLRLRGSDWILAEAPCTPAGKRPGTAQLRFVRVDGKWKLEQLRLTRQ